MRTREEFDSIKSDDELHTFLQRYEFVADTRPNPSQVLGVYLGHLEGVTAKVTLRWHDPSGPFQNEPDIHKAKLELDGKVFHEIAYEG